MTVQQLRYFTAIADLNSITKASEVLHISQPSLSASVKELEAEFGVSLFERHYRGVTLTVEGNAFYKMSQEILGSIQKTENLMKDMGNGRKILKLGSPPMMSSLILPHIYNDFVPVNADISLELVEGGYHELLRKLLDGDLDLVFLPHTASLDSSLSSLHVADLEVICCANQKHPIAKHPCVCPQHLKEVPVVLFENTFFQSQRIMEWFGNEKVAPHILLQTEQLSTVISMIANSNAVGFIFRKLIDAHRDLIAIPTEKPMNTNVSLVWKSTSRFTYAMKKFADYIKTDNPFEKGEAAAEGSVSTAERH